MALRQQLRRLTADKETEVIIVDNFSSKENAMSVSALSKNATHIVLNKENLGFAAAGNIGARLARGEWILFLNPDVTISTAAVHEFVAAAAAQKLDAASPKTSDSRYLKPLPTPVTLVTEFSPLRRLIPLSIFKQKTLTGGCLLIRREIFVQIGTWDEDFFLWFEDSDLTKRLIDGGYKIGWVDVNAEHAGGVSFRTISESRRILLFFTSMSIYAKKHFGRIGERIIRLLANHHGVSV